MVVGLGAHWKLPIGFFFVAGLDAAGEGIHTLEKYFFVVGPLRGGGGDKNP